MKSRHVRHQSSLTRSTSLRIPFFTRIHPSCALFPLTSMNVYLAFLSVTTRDHGPQYTAKRDIDCQANHASTQCRRCSTSITPSRAWRTTCGPRGYRRLPVRVWRLTCRPTTRAAFVQARIRRRSLKNIRSNSIRHPPYPRGHDRCRTTRYLQRRAMARIRSARLDRGRSSRYGLF
jgi:hypothetical protein